jgi:hypothetical protein
MRIQNIHQILRKMFTPLVRFMWNLHAEKIDYTPQTYSHMLY